MRGLLLCLALALPSASARGAELTATLGPAEAARRAVLRSTTDIGVLGPVIAAFLESRPDTAIVYEQWGSNDLYDLAVAACAGRAPPADLVISSAVHHMVDLVNEGCAATSVSNETAALPDELRWRDQLWGISREPAVMVYNRDLLNPGEVPQSRFDLLDLLRPRDSRFEGRVATYDVEASGLGYLLAFMDSLEASTFGGLLEAFGRSGAVATCCSAEIIDAVISGEYLVGYNVLGSYALLRAEEDARLGVIIPSDYVLTLSRAAMIPLRAGNRALAAELRDFLLSPEGRGLLERRHLIVGLTGDEGGTLEMARPMAGLERRIELSPTLLVARDTQKRRLFIERWRDAFPAGPARDAEPAAQLR